MIKLSRNIKKQILCHSLRVSPNESCGFIVFNGKNYQVIECENISEDKLNHATIKPEHYLFAKKQGEIIASYHSQQEGDFSEYDKQQSNLHNLPYILCSLKTSEFFTYIPGNYQSPYVGRTFEIHKSDCFTLIRDYYSQELNIKIEDFDRGNFEDSMLTGLILNNYIKQGFSCCDNLKQNDILLLDIKGGLGKHFGIFNNNNTILHQPIFGFSKYEKFDDYKDKVVKIFRYLKT